ncbi:MAG: Zn-ribbon domain-containing OB-fold protein [Methanobacteriota archaeon]|nr:MAG: Zn-ribbon domain-containing OB-fold protein [Euryarchaeota archaeon]
MSLPLNWRRIPYRYRLEGTECTNCNTAYFPPRSICPKCRRHGNLVKKAFKGTGRVVTYSRVDVPPIGFEKEAPYYIAVIELDEGTRLTAQVSGVDSLETGMRVKAVFRKIQQEDPEGLIHYGFKFVPMSS